MLGPPPAPKSQTRSAVSGLPTEAHARRTDPSTSHQAAKSVGGMNMKQLAVLALLRKNGPMTDEMLVRAYRECIDKCHPINGVILPDQADSGIRTRRSELASREPPMVRVKDIVKLASGRDAQRWEAVPA